jgi:hypothetical protein
MDFSGRWISESDRDMQRFSADIEPLVHAVMAG